MFNFQAECVLIYMLLFYQISAWVFLIHMFLYAGFYCIYRQLFRERNPVLPIEKCLPLVLPRNTIMLQHLIIQFPLSTCQAVAYTRLKVKENFKLLTLNVVKRFQLNFCDLTCWGEVVAYEIWLQLEVPL